MAGNANASSAVNSTIWVVFMDLPPFESVRTTVLRRDDGPDHTASELAFPADFMTRTDFRALVILTPDLQCLRMKP